MLRKELGHMITIMRTMAVGKSQLFLMRQCQMISIYLMSDG